MTMAPEASKMTGRSVIRRNEKDQHLYWDSFSPNAWIGRLGTSGAPASLESSVCRVQGGRGVGNGPTGAVASYALGVTAIWLISSTVHRADIRPVRCNTNFFSNVTLSPQAMPFCKLNHHIFGTYVADHPATPYGRRRRYHPLRWYWQKSVYHHRLGCFFHTN